MARKQSFEGIYTPSMKRLFLKAAVDVLYDRRELLSDSKLKNLLGTSESLGIRGLVISTMSRIAWKEEDVERKTEWAWELESLGLAEMRPTKYLPDTQPKHYYQARLTSYSREEAYQIINQS
jgi:hypothetical protein